MSALGPEPRRLGAVERWLFAGIGAAIVAALAVAAWLEPDARGLGTHEQLGLPACIFKSMLGIRCPSCGMTTAWSAVMHGRWRQAAEANTSGVLMAAGGAALAAAALGSAATGRSWMPREQIMVAAALGAVALTLCEWIIRLAWFS